MIGEKGIQVDMPREARVATAVYVTAEAVMP